MTIPDYINFLQMGRYGCFSEQTYRNNFENDRFECLSFNEAIIREHLKVVMRRLVQFLPYQHTGTSESYSQHSHM